MKYANLLFYSTEIQKRKFSSEQRVYTRPVHYACPIYSKDLNSAPLLFVPGPEVHYEHPPKQACLSTPVQMWLSTRGSYRLWEPLPVLKAYLSDKFKRRNKV